MGKIYESIKDICYHGYYDKKKGFGSSVVTVKKDGVTKELELRLDLGNHSPTGFSWGYGGSGPHQLALAILADFFGDNAAKQYSQMFKWDVIASLKQTPNEFDIYGHNIIDWASVHQVPWVDLLMKKYGDKERLKRK